MFTGIDNENVYRITGNSHLDNFYFTFEPE